MLKLIMFIMVMLLGVTSCTLALNASTNKAFKLDKQKDYQWCIDEIEMQYDEHEWEDMKTDCKEYLQ